MIRLTRGSMLGHSLRRASYLRSAKGLRWMSAGKKEDFVVKSTNEEGVTTLRMNRPKKLNGWTEPMLLSLFDAFQHAAADPNTKAVVLTGTGDYYCAGVDLGGTIKPMHPQSLFDKIVESNQLVFDTFIDFPKPLVIAANGPAIGASVTSATLCDAIVASDRATFSTPFGRLGVTPEGCSSVHFERIMGPENAVKMLQKDWKPSAQEALDIGLVDEVVPHDELHARAVAVAAQRIAEGRERRLKEEGLLEEYKEVNRKESVDLANAFLSEKFLAAQRDFATSKGKTGPARLFSVLLLLRPLWINFVKSAK